jgi:signal transduction histidine kinase
MQRNRTFLPFLLLVLALLAVFAIAISTVITALMPTEQATQMLFIYLIISAGVTIALVYLLYRGRVVQQFTSLRWTLLATILLLVSVVLVNVFVTLRLMLIESEQFILFTALLIFGGAVAIVSALFISGGIIERIDALAKASEQVARGVPGTRLPVAGNDELARLSAMFNDMALALETTVQKQRELEQTRRDLVAWASHDLRSPLAAVRAMNEAILDGVVTDEATLLRYRTQMQHEIEHLGRLIEDLFEMAQMDAGHLLLERAPTDIDELISRAVASSTVRAQARSVALAHTIAPALPRIPAAPDKIARVIYNLLDNALHHTPPGGRIHVQAEREGAGVCIGVHNTGSYISSADLPRIFERFYRGENARTPRSDGQRGTGLGLAIARGFVEAHGGSIRVESDASVGTTFKVWLPAA